MATYDPFPNSDFMKQFKTRTLEDGKYPLPEDCIMEMVKAQLMVRFTFNIPFEMQVILLDIFGVTEHFLPQSAIFCHCWQFSVTAGHSLSYLAIFFSSWRLLCSLHTLKLQNRLIIT